MSGSSIAVEAENFRPLRLNKPKHHWSSSDSETSGSPLIPSTADPSSAQPQKSVTRNSHGAVEDHQMDKAPTFRKRRLSLTVVPHDATGGLSRRRRPRRSSVGNNTSEPSTRQESFPSRTLHAAELLAPSPPVPSLLPHDTHTSTRKEPHSLYQQTPLPPPLSLLTTRTAHSTAWHQTHTLLEEHQLPFPSDMVGTFSCHGVEPVYDDSEDGEDDDEEEESPNTAASGTEDKRPEWIGPPSLTEDVGKSGLTMEKLVSEESNFATPTTTEDGSSEVTTDTIELGDGGPINRMVSKINQDRGGVVFPYGNSNRTALFAVYDGHGQGGEMVSQFALHEVQHRLEKHDAFPQNLKKAMEETFLAVDRALTQETLIEPLFSGTTACVAVLCGKVLTLANVGDSRAVMARRRCEHTKSSSAIDAWDTLDLTMDQNPDLPEEHRRIVAAGGFVSPPPGPGLSARVWLDPACSQIGLAMARSLGDHAVGSVGVVADPVVTTHELDALDDFMIVASDGVWEFLKSEDAVRIVGQHLAGGNGATKACRALIEAAAAKWHEEEGEYRDDITAIVVRFAGIWDAATIDR